MFAQRAIHANLELNCVVGPPIISPSHTLVAGAFSKVTRMAEIVVNIVLPLLLASRRGSQEKATFIDQ